jgi:hypothetical protein
MFCSISITSSVQPQEIVIRMGTDMKTNPQLNSQSLLPAERLAVAACMGSLLTAIGFRNILTCAPNSRRTLVKPWLQSARNSAKPSTRLARRKG